MQQTLAEKIAEFRRERKLKSLEELGILSFPLGSHYMYIHKDWWDKLRSRDLVVKNHLGQWIAKREAVKELWEFDQEYKDWQDEEYKKEQAIKKYGKKIGEAAHDYKKTHLQETINL